MAACTVSGSFPILLIVSYYSVCKTLTGFRHGSGSLPPLREISFPFYLSRLTFFTVRISPTQDNQFSDTAWVSCNSVLCRHQLPRTSTDPTSGGLGLRSPPDSSSVTSVRSSGHPRSCPTRPPSGGITPCLTTLRTPESTERGTRL